MTSSLTYELSQHVKGVLNDRGFTIPVLYGPEVLQRQHPTKAVVFEHDRETGGVVVPPMGAQGPPRRNHRTRNMGCVVHFFVASTAEGARIQDHEGLCDEIVDAVMIAVDEGLVASKSVRPTYLEAKYVKQEELPFALLNQWPGVVYRLRFLITRGVVAKDYAGSALEAEGTIAAFTFTGEAQIAENTDTLETF